MATITAKVQGKSIIFNEDQQKALRLKLRNGVSYDALDEKERVLGVEMERKTALSWYKSNQAAKKTRELRDKVFAIHKNPDLTAEQKDAAIREAILSTEA